jgi:ribonuclease HI
MSQTPSRKKRRNVEDDLMSFDLPTSRRETETQREERRSLPESQAKPIYQLDTSKQIPITFDGGARGNGTETARAAAGVFVLDYNCRHSRGQLLPDVRTNNLAEIIACTIAVNTAERIYRETTEAGHPPPTFVLRGDSSLVVASILEGRILSYTDAGRRTTNGQAWNALRIAIITCAEMDIQMEWEWIPRELNREADELLNAMLDGREPDENVRSDPRRAPPCRDSMLTMIETIYKKSLNVHARTHRKLPVELGKHWRSFLFFVFGTPYWTDAQRRGIFLIAPQLLSSCTRRLQNRKDFKLLRAHISLLKDTNYLMESLVQLAEAHRPTPVIHRPLRVLRVF